MRMGIAPTAASGDGIVNGRIQALNRKLAVEIGIQFAERGDVARAKATIDNLHGEFPVRCRAAVANAVGVFEFLNQLLRAHYVARHAVTEEHEVAATRLCAKVSVESEEAVDSACGGTEVLRNDIRGGQRNPPEVLVDFLECREYEFLGFLMIPIGKVREHFPHDIEIDLPGENLFFGRVLRQITCLAGDDRRHLFQFQLPLNARKVKQWRTKLAVRGRVYDRRTDRSTQRSQGTCVTQSVLPASEQCLEVAIKAVQEAVHIQNVVHIDRVPGWYVFLIQFGLSANMLFAQPP